MYTNSNKVAFLKKKRKKRRNRSPVTYSLVDTGVLHTTKPIVFFELQLTLSWVYEYNFVFLYDKKNNDKIINSLTAITVYIYTIAHMH